MISIFSNIQMLQRWSLVGRRTLATSAEKRKWKRQMMSSKEKRTPLFQTEEVLETSSTKKEKDLNPFLFLVVFPLAMTGLVITLRKDLREELAEKGRQVGGTTN